MPCNKAQLRVRRKVAVQSSAGAAAGGGAPVAAARHCCCHLLHTLCLLCGRAEQGCPYRPSALPLAPLKVSPDSHLYHVPLAPAAAP
jgi:hypothetical protein